MNKELTAKRAEEEQALSKKREQSMFLRQKADQYLSIVQSLEVRRCGQYGNC